MSATITSDDATITSDDTTSRDVVSVEASPKDQGAASKKLLLAPLSALHWTWNQGYTIMRIDLTRMRPELRSERVRRGDDGLFLSGARLKVSRRWNLIEWSREKSSKQSKADAASNADYAAAGTEKSGHFLLNIAERFQRQPDIMRPMNLGFGLALDIEQGRLEPHLRLRSGPVAARLLPWPPGLECRANFPVPLSKTLRICVRCEADLPAFNYESSKDMEPKFSIRLFSQDHGGVFLTSSGRLAIEQDYIRIAPDSYARVGIEVNVPDTITPQGVDYSNEDGMQLRLTRLGLRLKLP